MYAHQEGSGPVDACNLRRSDLKPLLRVQVLVAGLGRVRVLVGGGKSCVGTMCSAKGNNDTST